MVDLQRIIQGNLGKKAFFLLTFLTAEKMRWILEPNDTDGP